MLYKASAPGSLMLLGEYAVLHGKKAIVCAVNKRIHVSIAPRTDDQLCIYSTLGQYTDTVTHFTVSPPFEFVLTALKSKQHLLPTGCDIAIEAEFPSNIGLGSSAAVSVAILAALNQWLSPSSLTEHVLWQEVKAVVDQVQRNGSGADIAASIFGGTLVFQPTPWRVTPLKQHPPICAVYSGKKTPTPEAIQLASQRYIRFPELFQHIDALSDQLVNEAIPVIEQQQWETLGYLWRIAQGLLQIMEVSNDVIDRIVQTLIQQPDIYGAKISGSGLGDCVVGLGALALGIFPQDDAQKEEGVKQVPITVTSQGVRIDTHST
ncbi:MAG: hypothetical protein A3F41_01165 [Coxiella sp. RIFCSPHIGHO2_12_FULL_44_14]|nr:MAG: hypothetical protein A3F41_01165 [Coxiella sp. RIFCSPHIGHO2_12_FULL_44_14]